MPRSKVDPLPTAVSPRNLVATLLIVLLVLFAASATSRAQPAPVGLGTAGNFAVLAGETITNTGPTTITGDVGLHPGSDVTGFDTVTHDGELHVADAVAQQAKVDLVTAYDSAAGAEPTTAIAVELGGLTLPAGVYGSGNFGLTGTLTLDAQGDPDAVFIFQMETTLVTASGSAVELIDGADPCNVFWQVGSSATLGTGTTFVGNILALTSIALQTGATIEGRALARNGEVTMDTNTITQAACVTAVDDDTGDNGDGDNGDSDTGDTDDNGDSDTGDSDNGDNGDGENGTPPPATQVPPPTRVDTGGGGTA